MADYNATNPTHTVAVTAGDDTQTPDTQTISLSVGYTGIVWDALTTYAKGSIVYIYDIGTFWPTWQAWSRISAFG